MKLRNLMFVLPNLFTLTSIFCGFYAVTLCAGEPTPSHFYQAALAIFFAMFFDGFDGRVARLTKTQSQFGVELDSLADVMSFGLAPGLLVYKWALAPLGFLGMFISFAFAACGALRLARFNVIAQRSPSGGASRFFVGLPIPLAAGVVISMVIAHHGAFGGEELDPRLTVPVAAVVSVLALLMVSTLRYRTFKSVKFSATSVGIFLLVAGGGVLVATQLHPALVLVAYFSVYLVLGFVESGMHLGRVLGARKVTSNNGAAVMDDDEDEEEDEQDYL